MGWTRKRQIILSDKQKMLLHEVSKAHTSTRSHGVRARIILLTAEGYSQRKVVSELGITHCTVNYWKKRWHDNHEILLAHDKELSGSSYRKALLDVLTDKLRPGCPGKFSAEQICQIMNVACETPEESGLPLSHWTLSELAEELVRRKIVESISTSQLSVFLKSGGYKTP